jgi:hypothetical protein
MAHPKQLDSIHGSVLGPGGPISVTDFNFDEVDFNLGLTEPGDGVAMSDVTSAFVRILQWICSGDGMASKGGRAEALRYFLDPTQSEYDSLDAIGQEAGVSRAALSAALMDLRKELKLGQTLGKRDYCRAVYSEAQRRAFKAGVHSSHTRKDSRAKRAAAEKPAPAVSD